jgi:membrane protease YdiL (CAAX protease family)
VVTLAVAVEGGLALLAVGLGWLLDHPPLSPVRFQLDAWGLFIGVAATIPMLALFLATLRWPVGPLRAIKSFTEKVVRPLLAPCTMVDLLGISVLAGFGEETLFRGLLQDMFVGWFREGLPAAADLTPVCLGVAVASLLFGLLHAVTPTYAVLATLMGAYMGVVYLWSGNLLAAMVAHGLYDFVVLIYLMYGPGSAEMDPSGESQSPEEAPADQEKEQQEPAP